MARRLTWERCAGGTYSWPLGLHYYAEKEDGAWGPCCMVCDTDIWTGEPCATRAAAEAAMQAHFDAEIAKWAGDRPPESARLSRNSPEAPSRGPAKPLKRNG